MSALSTGIALGIYEKALRSNELGSPDDWRAFFSQVPEAGFSFVDLSVDESPRRMARLEWDQVMRRGVRRAAEEVGIVIGGLCLSVHRATGPGSADPAARAKAREQLDAGLRLCHDLGIPVLQVAGYFCYYEQPNPHAEKYYIEMLRDAVPLAARLGVTMGIENVDGNDVVSIRKAMEYVEMIDSPYLQMYPDIGNIAEQDLDAAEELGLGRGRMVAIHVKDVRRGEPRRVGMGEGIVDWDLAFSLLKAQEWTGRMMIEMWNDDAPDSVRRCSVAREFIEDRLSAAGLAVARPPRRCKPSEDGADGRDVHARC